MTQPPRKKPQRRRGAVIAGVVVIALMAGFWVLSRNISGVNIAESPVSTVNLLPPPPPAPPPPPPPKEKPPEPDKLDPPKPQDPKTPDQPRQLTIAGPAQAGGDAFGIKAGAGGGSSVIGGTQEGGTPGSGGFAEASYGRYLSSEIQQTIQSDDHVNRQIFAADVAVWIDSLGRLTRAKILKSSGDNKLDRQLVASLEGMGALSEPPPAAFRFPQRVAIKGRRGA
jgi:periplasmic protein TonB